MTMLARTHPAPAVTAAAAPAAPATDRHQRAVVLGLGGFLVVLGVLVAALLGTGGAETVVVPSVPDGPVPAMSDFDGTGGLVWQLYRQAGGSLAP